MSDFISKKYFDIILDDKDSFFPKSIHVLHYIFFEAGIEPSILKCMKEYLLEKDIIDLLIDTRDENEGRNDNYTSSLDSIAEHLYDYFSEFEEEDMTD